MAAAVATPPEAAANWQEIFTLTENRSAFQRTVNTLYKSGWVPEEFEYLHLGRYLTGTLALSALLFSCQ